MSETCEHCGGPVEVSNCAYTGCLVGWQEFQDELKQAEKEAYEKG